MNLSVLDNTKYGTAISIYVSGTDIHIAGYTYNSSDIRVPCYWLNGTRTDLSVLDSNSQGRAYSIFVNEE
jgi:hypothetical protein